MAKLGPIDLGDSLFTETMECPEIDGVSLRCKVCNTLVMEHDLPVEEMWLDGMTRKVIECAECGTLEAYCAQIGVAFFATRHLMMIRYGLA